jgi:hypothetical protein
VSEEIQTDSDKTDEQGKPTNVRKVLNNFMRITATNPLFLLGYAAGKSDEKKKQEKSNAPDNRDKKITALKCIMREAGKAKKSMWITRADAIEHIMRLARYAEEALEETDCIPVASAAAAPESLPQNSMVYESRQTSDQDLPDPGEAIKISGPPHIRAQLIRELGELRRAQQTRAHQYAYTHCIKIVEEANHKAFVLGALMSALKKG